LTAAPAPGDLLGVEAVVETSEAAEAAGYWTVGLYAVFDDPQDVVFNVFNRTISTTAGMFINIHAVGVAAWDAPPSWMLQSNPALAYDSFVTIGPATGDVNDTQVDPNFDVAAFAEQGLICCDAGWYNALPTNGQGVAGLYPNNKVLLARLTMPVLAAAAPAALEGSLELTYINGSQQIIQTDPIAFSAVAPVPIIDCNGNGVHDALDVANGASLDVDGNGEPDECQTLDLPVDAILLSQGQITGTGADVEESDNVHLIVHSPVLNSQGTQWSTDIRFRFDSPWTTISNLDIKTEVGSNSGPIGTTKISLYNWTTASWTELLAYQQLAADTIKVFDNIANPNAYVNDANGKILVRIRCLSRPAAIPQPFTVKIDHVEALVNP
jgi:hypothetical protein